jgi:aminoglycoside phosphotransferase (APT) family kinase protein
MHDDTSPIRDEERFDEGRVGEYLRSVIPALDSSTPLEFAQFHGGHANLTYVVRSGDLELVLRRPPLGEVAPGGHDMAREHKVLSVLHQSYPLAPQAFHYCADASILGKPFFVMERRRGTVVRGRWPESLPDGLQQTVAESFVDSIGSLHQVAFEPLGLADLGRPDGFVERQVAGWTDRWNRSRDEPTPDMERLAVALADGHPAPQRASIVHNDFKLDNTMVGDDGRVTAVFDWDMSTIGDPLVDLGTTLSYWDGPDEAAIVVPPDGQVLGGLFSADEIVVRYQQKTGLDCSSINWYRALASFRIAVILQQIYIRYARGQTTDERFSALGAVVGPIAAAGLDQLAET